MGQYKVPQNVESEDRLIGPLTMKQFIYALIGLGWGFLIWRIFMAGGTVGILLMILLILPISGFMFLLAFGRREEQSFENYLIALIRFNVVPRKRIWMKDDIAEEVIVAAPKEEPVQFKTPEEMEQIRSRLSQLALVVDTRGHSKSEAIQTVDPANAATQFSQRVFTPSSLQTELVQNQMQVQDDILSSAETGQHAQQVGTILQGVEQDIRQQAMQAMANPQAAPTPPQPSPQPAPNDAILKTVMNTANLSVAQVAQAANRGQLTPGQSVQVR